jgi:hypothetical protein
MNPSNIAQFEALRTMAAATIAATYAIVGTAVTHPIRMFRLVNDTDTDMIASLDGVADHFYVPSGSFVLYDLCANRELQGSSFMLPIGTGFYVKYVADPSSGNFAVEACYGRGQ